MNNEGKTSDSLERAKYLEMIAGKTGILEKLKFPTGEPVDLIDWVLRHNLELLIMAGKPGTGKSSVSEQLAAWLAALGFLIRTVRFDDFVTSVEDYTGKPPRDFNDRDWLKLSEKLIEKVESEKKEMEVLTERGGQNHLVVLDVPGLVSRFAQPAIETILEKYPQKTGIGAIAGDIRTQQKSICIRFDAERTHAGEIERKMRDRYNLRVLWLTNRYPTLLQRGERLKALHGNMAPGMIIEMVNELVRKEHESIPDFDRLRQDYAQQLQKSGIVFADRVQQGDLADRRMVEVEEAEILCVAEDLAYLRGRLKEMERKFPQWSGKNLLMANIYFDGPIYLIVRD